MISVLYVLYDDECGFCCACARWLIAQPKRVNVECAPRSHLPDHDPFPGLRSRPGQLTVVDDHGGVYEGDSAWLMAM